MDEAGGTDAPRPEGSLRNVGASILALLGTRLELLGVELREETLRAQQLLVMGAIAAMLLGAALVLAGIFLVIAFWDSNRLLALGAMTVLYAAAGVGLLRHIRASTREAPVPFAATAREFQADLDLLREPSEPQ